MKKTRRTAQVGQMIRDALVEVLRHDLKGINIGLASISAVEISPDLNFARVYITGMNAEDSESAVAELRKASARARHFLGQRIHLRFTPELDFKVDDTASRAGRIEDLLAELKPSEASSGDSVPFDEAPETESNEAGGNHDRE